LCEKCSGLPTPLPEDHFDDFMLNVTSPVTAQDKTWGFPQPPLLEQLPFALIKPSNQSTAQTTTPDAEKIRTMALKAKAGGR